MVCSKLETQKYLYDIKFTIIIPIIIGTLIIIN